MQLQSIFKILSVICLSFLLSCSSDESSSNSLVLIKKVTTVGEFQNSVSELVYENNVFKKGISGNNSVEFIYSGSKVVATKHYTNNVLTKTNNYVYDGDKLVSITSDGQYPERAVFFYSNNVLSVMELEYLDGTEWILHQRENFVFDSSLNLNQHIVLIDAGNQNITFRNVNYYDNKNNPTRDMNPYVKLSLGFTGIEMKSVNNVISYDSFSPSESTTASSYTNQITYNDNDFPIEIKRISPEGNLLSTTTIEYQ